MRKGEKTKKAILEHAAHVFSIRGYAGASMDVLTRAVQLTKGGLYNHFESKDELALASFDHTIGLVSERFAEMAAGLRDTRARLMAMMALYISLIEDPVVPGGCPILYTAVEADDTHPALRERAQDAAASWQDYIARTLTKGMAMGTVRQDVNLADTADFMLSSLEGAIVLAKLYGSSETMHRVVGQLTRFIDTVLLIPEEK